MDCAIESYLVKMQDVKGLSFISLFDNISIFNSICFVFKEEISKYQNMNEKIPEFSLNFCDKFT